MLDEMRAPEAQHELEQVADQWAASDPQRTQEIMTFLQSPDGSRVVDEYGPAAAFFMLFDPQRFGEALLTSAAQELAPGPRSGNPVHDVLEKYYGPSSQERMAQNQARPQPPIGGPKAVLQKYYGDAA